jgi:mannose-6-phosphate isomerase-like protein (cupin superfamily)
MPGYKVAKIDDIEGAYGGAFKRIRATLGISSFGIQVIDMPPNADGYPEHDHSSDGQEEVYTALRGSAEMQIDGQSFSLDPDTVIAVQAGTMRKVIAGDEGIRMLIIGGKPGSVYEAPEISELEGAAAS